MLDDLATVERPESKSTHGPGCAGSIIKCHWIHCKRDGKNRDVYRNNKLLHDVRIYLKEAMMEKQLPCKAGEPLLTAQYKLDNPELIHVSLTNNGRSAMMPESIALLSATKELLCTRGQTTYAFDDR